MLFMKTVTIADHERGFLYKDRSFVKMLEPGKHRFYGNVLKLKVNIHSITDLEILEPKLQVIVRSGALEGHAKVVDLAQHQRALIRIDGRLYSLLKPGLYAFWTVLAKVEVTVFDIREIRLEHPELQAIMRLPSASTHFEKIQVSTGTRTLMFVDGNLKEVLTPGLYVYWRDAGNMIFQTVPEQEQILEIQGQELLTADRVSLRLNALLTYRIADPVKAYMQSTNPGQALYREAQLALRSAASARDLEELLNDREAFGTEITEPLTVKATQLGLELISFGLRDIILPGEMRTLMNRVVEARKAAEASLITRREETAAMRSQANTAKIFESNPGLMRLRELEVLEKIAEKTNLTVVLGEAGLTDRVTKLL